MENSAKKRLQSQHALEQECVLRRQFLGLKWAALRAATPFPHLTKPDNSASWIVQVACSRRRSAVKPACFVDCPKSHLAENKEPRKCETKATKT